MAMGKSKGGRGMVAVTVTMVLFFMWALWVSVSHQGHHRNRGDDPGFIETEEHVGRFIETGSNPSVKKRKKPGTVYDLNKNSHNFQIEGFRYHSYSPLRDKKLKAESVWVLSTKDGESKRATIRISGLQRLFKKSRRKTNRNQLLKDVIVVIKYHLHWSGMTVTVTGTDIQVKEQIEETLPIHDEEHYCTVVVYMGQVNQILLEANAEKRSHLIIDELKVIVGSELYDDVEEVTCH